MKRFLTRVIKRYFQLPILILLLMFVFPLYSQTEEILPDSYETEVSENDEDNSESEEELKGDDIELRTVVIKGTKLEGRKKKNIQEISRHTMTAQEMKQVPASFGDSLSAITSLPGIMRAGGDIFGPMVIRGADIMSNNYFIDDIPVHDPMHLGGLHSIINTNLMDEIDVYSSSFPAQFGSATSAVINITTVDKVEKFGGYTDFGLISVNALIQTPILKNKYGNIVFDRPDGTVQDKDTENVGYLITSARYGNFQFAIELVELFTGDEIPITPVYWDYQVKGKYYFTKSLSLTLFIMGFKDYFKILIEDNDLLEEGDDPYFSDFDMNIDKTSHSQALYFDFEPSRKFNNRFICFTTFPESHFRMNFGSQGTADWAKDFHTNSRPRIFSAKDKFKYRWYHGIMETRGALEYQMYYFNISGKTIMPRGNIQMGGPLDPGDETLFDIVFLDDTIKNHLYGGYLENKMVIAGLTVIPGVRSDYLERTGIATFDPRIMASYKFQTDTTISAASGKYSYFFQVNPFLFDTNANVAKIDDMPPEEAIHNSIGFEQGYKLYSFKLEGFYNKFFKKAVPFMHTQPDGTESLGFDDAEAKAYGVEVMIKKDKRENVDGFFGWLSYTYTISKQKSNVPAEIAVDASTDIWDGVPDGRIEGDPYGNTWLDSQFEQKHVVKLVAGYAFGHHTFSGKFQYFTLTPINEIVGGDEPDENYIQINDSYPEERYPPEYNEKPNTKRLPPYHRLDIRYSYKTTYSWGYLTFYVELINAYNHHSKEYKWFYDRPYNPGSNPKIRETEGFAILPNFGVEVKF